MLTQIVCPKCQNPYTAEVHQIVDVGQEPELKMALLNGYLNVAVCPHCRTATQVATPLLYHDPEHELFMVYVPIELTMKQADQEKLIGQLVRRAMDNLPPEQRRGYMFQPQTIISLQTFMEKILETEGITPEMLARQRKQAELLQTLATADKEVVDILLKERADEIDEGFFALLRASIDAAEQAGQDDRALKLINLQARLYRETEYGRRLDQQQRALHAFSREARKEGLTPKLLLKHVLANRDDEMVVDALIMAGQQAFNYQFFAELSDKIEKRQKSGVESEEYLKLREHLLEIQEALQRRSQEILEGAQRTLQEILRAEDKAAAVRANLRHIDDAFMYVLSANLAQAEQRGNTVQAMALRDVQELIMQEIESQSPPEIRLINQLIRAETKEAQQQLLDKNGQLIRPDLLRVVQAIKAEMGESNAPELDSQLAEIEALIEARLKG